MEREGRSRSYEIRNWYIIHLEIESPFSHSSKKHIPHGGERMRNSFFIVDLSPIRWGFCVNLNSHSLTRLSYLQATVSPHAPKPHPSYYSMYTLTPPNLIPLPLPSAPPDAPTPHRSHHSSPPPPPPSSLYPPVCTPTCTNIPQVPLLNVYPSPTSVILNASKLPTATPGLHCPSSANTSAHFPSIQYMPPHKGVVWQETQQS